MNKQEIQRKIAYMEFVNDQLASEIQDLDRLMRAVGFKQGVAALKETAADIYHFGFNEEEE